MSSFILRRAALKPNKNEDPAPLRNDAANEIASLHHHQNIGG